MASIPGVTLTKAPISSPPVSTSPQPPSVMSPAKKESDTGLRQEGNFTKKILVKSRIIKGSMDQVRKQHDQVCQLRYTNWGEGWGLVAPHNFYYILSNLWLAKFIACLYQAYSLLGY